MGPDALPEQPDPNETRGDVVFAGGEPTLAPDLPDRVRAAVSAGARRVLVQTNGRRLAYAGYLDQLVAAGVTHLDVSLHGPIPAVHDYHTAVDGSFLQTVKGLQNAVHSRASVGVTTVVTRSNFRHLPAMADLLRRLGVRAWHLSAARPTGAASDDAAALVPRLGMLPEVLDTTIKRAIASRIDLVTTGIPPCVTPGDSHAELDTTPPTGARPKPCMECLLADRCAGPVPGYSSTFAELDLTPFTDVTAALRAGGVEEGRVWFGGIGAVPVD